MSISEKDIHEHDNIIKKILYDKIEKIYSKQAQIIMQGRQMLKDFDIDIDIDIDTDLPNIGITFNNKLNELSNEFKKAEISIFSEPNEEYDFVDLNFVGKAIIDDISSQVARGTQAISEFDSSLKKATEKKIEKIKALETTGPIKKLFLKIRSLFIPNTITDMTLYLQEEIEEINSHLSEYRDINENLWNYNLRDNVVHSIVNYIITNQYSDSTILGLLEEYIIPTLKKLGIEDVIPQLKDDLSKANGQKMESNHKSWELSVSQNLEIQLSSERIANDFTTKENGISSRENLEYDE